MFEEIARLKKSNRKGLALDIDETLSWTLGWWIERMQKLFGNPEELTVRELAEKYRYTQNVPYWQTEEALKWMDMHREADEIQIELPLIEGADEAVSKLDKIVPIIAYISVRPDSVRKGTQDWLRKHKFPKAQLITRPAYVDHSKGNEWKADVLNYLYPNVAGIVDDNPSVANYLPEKYEGTIFLYNNSEYEGKTKSVVPCNNWSEVLINAERVFKK